MKLNCCHPRTLTPPPKSYLLIVLRTLSARPGFFPYPSPTRHNVLQGRRPVLDDVPVCAGSRLATQPTKHRLARHDSTLSASSRPSKTSQAFVYVPCSYPVPSLQHTSMPRRIQAMASAKSRTCVHDLLMALSFCALHRGPPQTRPDSRKAIKVQYSVCGCVPLRSSQ